MRADFERGAYNVQEHNHVEWPIERLRERLTELHANDKVIHYSGERLAQVRKEMALIGFEMSERYRESKNQQIEEAWREYSGTVDA